MLWFANPNDPDEDPMALFFFSAQNGSISGMEKAMSKDSQVLFMVDCFEGMSALHAAAASPNPKAVDAVRWLLKKGIPWSATDRRDRLPEEWARIHGNEASCAFLRGWAIEFEYELYYSSSRTHPDQGKPFSILRMDEELQNTDFCKSFISYLNPHGAPEDEVALVTSTDSTGVMMEWERPIMRETARLLLDGMPTTGLRVLNIGFGIGMIDTYFQDAQPAEHVIIEGHPMCLKWMRQKGWYDRLGVRILEGRWQDFFPEAGTNPSDSLKTLYRNLLHTPCVTPQETRHVYKTDHLLSSQKPVEYMVDIGKFDVVFFDTFEEGYRGHFDFIKNVPGLLRGPGSRFSYFNAHAVKGHLQYQIYMEVARLHHNDLGMNTEYFSVYVDPKTIWYDLQDRHKDVGNVDRPQPTIPICTLAPTIPRHIVADVGWGNNRYTPPA